MTLTAERVCRICQHPLVGKQDTALFCSIACKGRAKYLRERDTRVAQVAAWRAEHPDESRSRAIAYYWAHREERVAQKAIYRAANRKEVNARQAVYARANPEKMKDHGHRRRGRNRSQFVEAVDFGAIYTRDNGLCHICGKKVQRAKATLDHLTPIARGGVHAAWNVRIAHLSCNQRRNVHGSAQLLLAGVL